MKVFKDWFKFVREDELLIQCGHSKIDKIKVLVKGDGTPNDKHAYQIELFEP